MTQYFNRRTLAICLLTLILSLFINGGLKILNVSLSPTENVLRNVIFATKMLQVALLAFVIIQGIAQASTQKFTQSTGIVILAGAVYIVAGFMGSGVADAISPPIKLRGYQSFLDENHILVEAIEAYIEGQGNPPANLEALHPTYLTPPVAVLQPDSSRDSDAATLLLLIPYESIDAESAERVSYNYEFPVDESGQWQLAVSVYLGSFKSVRFIYSPTQNYDSDYGRIGEWAYTGAYE